MKMRLADFEEYMDEDILERGLDYYHNGRVIHLEDKGGSHYIAKVDGSEIYTVEIFLDHEEIVETYCDCPYDWGEYCKHQAAALYALRQEKSQNSIKPEQRKKTAPAQKQDLRTVLLNLQKNELINIILDFSNEYTEIEKRLMFKYAPGKDEISASKKLIREFINKSKRSGFIDWRNVNYAVQGAEMTLQKARSKMESGDTETAVFLCMAVLSIIVDMLQYSDDSSGTVGSLIEESISLIDKAAAEGIDKLNNAKQKKLFDAIMKEALNDRYEGWSNWRFDLLKPCTYFCDNADFRRKLENQLEAMLENLTDTSWSDEYDKENVKLLQLEIIERCDGREKADQFIKENIHYSEFREKAIARAFQKEEFDEVVKLCLEGEEADNNYLGLMKKWKEHRFRAYELLGDLENQRELALELLFQQDYAYYLKLKKLYLQEEWDGILKGIVERFKKQQYQSYVYEKILIEENLTAEMLEYCKRNIYTITNLYPYMIGDFFDDVNKLFVKYINQSAEESANRRQYKHVCDIIKTYKKACGKTNAQLLIGELKQKYKRRPAFVDELGKIR
jgi:hypothetical protein